MNLRFPMIAALLALAACSRAPEPAAPAVPDTPDAAASANGAEPATAERPALDVATVDGARYALAEHRGKWVVVNFWATWCAPCLKEMPELSALHAKAGDIEVVGLAYEDIETEDMLAFLKERPVSYPIAIIDAFAPPADFATPRGLPMTYLIAPDGTVAKQFLGPITAHDIEAAVAAGAPAGGAAG